MTVAEPASKRTPPPSLATKEKCQAMWERSDRTILGLARIARCHARTATYWMDFYGISREHSHRKAKDRERNPDWTPEPAILDLAEFPENAERTWEALIKWQGANQEWNVKQESAAVTLETDLPIGVCVRGDWHLCNENTDHATFLRHRDLILATPGMYTVEDGDLGDLFIQPGKMTGVHEALARPRTQRHLIWDAVRCLKGRVIATAAGQHDQWGVSQADFDPIEWVSADYRVPYLGHGGLLNLTVGKQLYRIHMRHKYRYNSTYNATHSIKQYWRFDGDSDIGIHADRHTPVIEQMLWKGEYRVAARPGSYKPTDDFMESFGYSRAQPVMPVLILWPNRRRILPVWSLEDGAEILTQLRGVS